MNWIIVLGEEEGGRVTAVNHGGCGAKTLGHMKEILYLKDKMLCKSNFWNVPFKPLNQMH